MELHEALSRITEIRSHIARNETFRGYRSATIGFSGLMAFVGATLQVIWIPRPMQNAHAYLGLWVAIAAVNALVCGVEMALRSFRASSAMTRQIMLLAIEQFLPCVIAGGMLTYAMLIYAPASLWLLPGLWAIVFSLGVFASCRLLPGAVFWVAIYYLAAGIATIALARDEAALSPWAMVGTFGVGQLLTAATLYFTLERTDGK